MIKKSVFFIFLCTRLCASQSNLSLVDLLSNFGGQAKKVTVPTQETDSTGLSNVMQLAYYNGKIIVVGYVDANKWGIGTIDTSGTYKGQVMNPDYVAYVGAQNQVLLDTKSGFAYLPYYAGNNDGVLEAKVEKRSLKDLSLVSTIRVTDINHPYRNFLGYCIIKGKNQYYISGPYVDPEESNKPFIASFNPKTGVVSQIYTNDNIGDYSGVLMNGIEFYDGKYVVGLHDNSGVLISMQLGSMESPSEYIKVNEIQEVPFSGAPYKYDDSSLLICAGSYLYKYTVDKDTGTLTLDESFASSGRFAIGGSLEVNSPGYLSNLDAGCTFNTIMAPRSNYIFLGGQTDNGTYRNPIIVAINLSNLSSPKLDTTFGSQGYSTDSYNYTDNIVSYTHCLTTGPIQYILWGGIHDIGKVRTFTPNSDSMENQSSTEILPLANLPVETQKAIIAATTQVTERLQAIQMMQDTSQMPTINLLLQN